jgi:phosphate/sulfate permease
VFGGSEAVVWYEPSSDFPFVKGFVPIVISWFLSPLLAALITLCLFLIIRSLVLRRANSTKIAFWVLPVLMVLTFFINLFFILVSVLLHSCCRLDRCGMFHAWPCDSHSGQVQHCVGTPGVVLRMAALHDHQ